MVVVQKTNNMERKTKSAFKLRSGNKPSMAMFKLFSGPQHTRTRDAIKKVKKKASDAYTYAKGYMKELTATSGMGASGRKYPMRAGEMAVRAKNKPLVIKHHTDKFNKGHLKMQPPGQTPPKTAKGRADVIKKALKKNKK